MIAQAELIAERAGQVDVLVLPGAAHLPWIDRTVSPDDITEGPGGADQVGQKARMGQRHVEIRG